MEPQCVKSRAAWNYLWLTSDYMLEVFWFFLKCVFTDTWAEVVLLKEDVCLTKSVLYQKDVTAGSVIFKEMVSCLRGQLRHLVTWAILWILVKTMMDCVNVEASIRWRITWIVSDRFGFYWTGMMSNKYNSLQNLSENKFDHMSKTPFPIFIILMITHHQTTRYCYKTYKT